MIASSTLALFACVTASAGPRPPDLPEHFASFRPLIGGVWEAEVSTPEGETHTWRLSFRAVLGNRFIRIVSRRVRGDRLVEESILMVGPDAETGGLKRWGFDSDGGVTETTITAVADGRRYDYRLPDGSEAAATYRSAFPDADTWELTATDRSRDGEAQPDEEWTFRRRSTPDIPPGDGMR